MSGSLKKLLIAGAGALLLWAAFSVFRGDEAYLRKVSKNLIKQALDPAALSDRAIFARINKMAGHIHADIHFSATADGRVYQNQSLGEARSFLLMWFKHESKKRMAEAGDLQVQILPPEAESGAAGGSVGGSAAAAGKSVKRAEVLFPFSFQEAGQRKRECRMTWRWVKEEGRWRIKTAELSACL